MSVFQGAQQSRHADANRKPGRGARERCKTIRNLPPAVGIAIPSDELDKFWWRRRPSITWQLTFMASGWSRLIKSQIKLLQMTEHRWWQHFTGSARGSEDTFLQDSLSSRNKNSGTYLRGPDDAHSKQQCGQRAHSGFKREAARERDKKV